MIRAVLCFALVACSSAPPPAHVTVISPHGHATPVAGSLLPPPAPPNYGWEWRGDKPGFGTSFYRGPREARRADVTCSFTYTEAPQLGRTSCARGSRELWHHDETGVFVADAALAIDGEVLYVARYSNISSGCILHAFDLRTGGERFATRLRALGPIAHSEYLAAVELRVVRGRPVVYGWESAGRYVEAVDPATGASVYNARVPDPPP